MPRKPRNVFSNGFFHIVCQGLNKEFIFSKSISKNYYLQLINKYSNKFSVTIIAYCIMDNHVHLLLYCNDISDISTMMKLTNTLFASFYNKIHNRVGYVFKDRFYSEIIKNEKHLYSCIQYIHMNPVKANIIDKAENYSFSSCRDYFNQTGIISDSLIQLISNGNNNFLEEILNISDSLYSFFDIDSYSKPDKMSAYKIIDLYIQKNDFDINIIKKDNILLKKVCHDLIYSYQIRQSYISSYFNVSKTKINRMSI